MALAVAVLLPVSVGGTAAAGSVGPQADKDPKAISSTDFDYISPDTLSEMRKQEALHPAVDAIYAAIEDLKPSGYSSLAFEGDGLTLYWKGEVPTTIATTVQTARDYGSIQVKQAAFSKAELDAAAQRLAPIVEAGTDVSMVAIHDGQGIVLHRMSPAVRARHEARIGSALAEISDVLSTVSVGVPVSIVDEDPQASFMGCSGPCNRLDDESPWNAGIFVGGSNGWLCSSGFALASSAPFSGYRLLTAAHCGSAGDSFTDWTGEAIGPVCIDDWDRDVAVLCANGWHWMFDGDSYTSNYKVVKSYANRVSWEWLCQSGRNGVKCDIQTWDYTTNIYIGPDSDGDYYWMHNMSVALRGGGLSAAVEGDSGGPVFSLDGTGVRAKGLVSATSSSEPAILYFTDMSNIVGRSGYAIKVG